MPNALRKFARLRQRRGVAVFIAKLIGEWWALTAALIVGVALLGLQLLFGSMSIIVSDLPQTPASIKLLLVVVSSLVLAVLGVSFWLSQPRCPHSRATPGHCPIGLLGVVTRDEMSGGDIVKMASRSYEWVGLSAYNEVTHTYQQDAIADGLRNDRQFSYVLLNPDDPLRTREQAHWEAVGEKLSPADEEQADARRALTDPEDLRANIREAVKCLRKLAQKGNLSLRLVNRIPWLRVTMLDERLLHVGHYDAKGCGYTGRFLVLEQAPPAAASRATASDPMLASWLSHFIRNEHCNGVIDDVYGALARLYCLGYRGDELTDFFLQSDDFAAVRSDFQRHFDWSLDRRAVKESVQYVSHRFGLDAIGARVCPHQNTGVGHCGFGIPSVISRGRDAFEAVAHAERSVDYYGATGYHPLHTMLSADFPDKATAGPEQASARFLTNRPEGPAIKVAELLFGRSPELVPSEYAELHERLFAHLAGSQKSGQSVLCYCDIVPGFRIVQIDQNTIHVSFYTPHKAIADTPVLVLRKTGAGSSGGVDLYSWFAEFMRRMEYSAALWDVERYGWSSLADAVSTQTDREWVHTLRTHAREVFSSRGLSAPEEALDVVAEAIWLSIQQSRRQHRREENDAEGQGPAS